MWHGYWGNSERGQTNWVGNVESWIDLPCFKTFCFECPSRYSQTKKLLQSFRSNNSSRELPSTQSASKSGRQCFLHRFLLKNTTLRTKRSLRAFSGQPQVTDDTNIPLSDFSWPHAGSSTCGFGWNIFRLPRRIAKYFMIIKEPFRLENKFFWTWSVSPRSINKAGPEKNHFWRAVSWINCQRSWFDFQACEIFIPELLNSKQ